MTRWNNPLLLTLLVTVLVLYSTRRSIDLIAEKTEPCNI